MARVVGQLNAPLQEQVTEIVKRLGMAKPPYALDFNAFIIAVLLMLARRVGEKAIVLGADGKIAT